MLDFEKWASEMIRSMAEDFTKCDDQHKIAEALEIFNQLWVSECNHRSRQTDRIHILHNAMSRVREKSE